MKFLCGTIIGIAIGLLIAPFIKVSFSLPGRQADSREVVREGDRIGPVENGVGTKSDSPFVLIPGVRKGTRR